MCYKESDMTEQLNNKTQPLCLSWIPPHRQGFHLLLQASQYRNSPFKAFQAKLAFSTYGHLLSHPLSFGAQLRSTGGGHGNPLQYSCLENPMDRGAWWATVHGVAQSQTRLSDTACTRFCPWSQLPVGACVWLSMVNWKPSSF